MKRRHTLVTTILLGSPLLAFIALNHGLCAIPWFLTEAIELLLLWLFLVVKLQLVKVEL